MRRTVLLTALVLLIAAPPAHAQDKVCRVPDAAAAADVALQQALVARAQFGFSVDVAYVKSLLERGSYQRDMGSLPVSAAERRYLDLRDRLTTSAAENRYLRRLGDAYVGWSVVDAWPREPQLVVHFTRDPARHLAKLKPLSRFPRNLRADRVRYSERDLERVERRIWADDRALEKAGFTVVEASDDLDTNRVEVELVTRRTDHAAYFAKRYGAAVRTTVISAEPTELECTEADGYSVAGDDLHVDLGWTTGGGAVTERIEVTEHPDRVEIGIVERVPVGARTLEAREASAVVQLAAPLNRRPVFDASNGRRMLQSGPSPGDPPCPVPAERTPLEQALAERAQYGMNVHPGYVQSLLDDDRTFTERERKWVKRLRRIEYQSGVHDYEQHWREDWGGTALIADYPAKPYLLVRWVARRAFHERNLKRITKWPRQLRTETATHQVDELYELELTIRDDARATDGFLDGYGPDGFFVVGTSANELLGKLELRVVTRRTDAAAYFTGRYGDLVAVTVVGDRPECRAGYSGG